VIYLDNAATSFPKPLSVRKAIDEAVLRAGNPGRGSHSAAIWSATEIYRTRELLAGLFNIDDPLRIAFTLNATHALNIAVNLCKGEIITTSMEHNSVLRPLKALERQGVSQSVVRADREGFLSAAEIEKTLRPQTRLIVATAASNVTGTKLPLAEIGQLARKRGILFMVDGAQGAGSVDLDVKRLNIDLLAFPGHKGLLGPLGTGALYVSPDTPLAHTTEGGTGTESKSRIQPCEFPEGYEAGTLNAPAIIGLGHSADFVYRIGPEVIGKYEEELIGWLDNCLDSMDFVERYGPSACRKTGISLINIRGMDAEEVTEILSRDYGIAVRGGFHCAGLAHKTIGTWDRGAVRISVGPFNTLRDMQQLADAIAEIGRRQNH